MNGRDDTPPPPAEGALVAADSVAEEQLEARAEGKARKERVIHTRVPAVLEEELKRFAEGLRVPVSNVIRTLLEDALAVADRATGRIEQELRQAADSLEEERIKLGQKLPRRDPLEGVIGFQQIVTNIATKCANCAAPLEPGDDAYLGLTDHQSAGRRVLVCANCVPRRNPKSP
jgi:hypothetical protein